MAKKKDLNFESKLDRLEEIVDLLDRGEASLEEQLEQFEEGMELSKSCREFLEKAELKVVEISKENGLNEIISDEDDDSEDDDPDDDF